jgi:hypothetical protein
VVMFIATSRGVRKSQFEAEITGTVASWSLDPGLWFNRRAGIYCHAPVGPL